MRITLQIENIDRLQTGGQVSYSCTDRGFDIGRHEHLDWSLPDPQRIISGKHCEVRFEGGNFVLYDISTNGTFLNGNPNRMDKAHALRSGDRIMVGDYIISVALDQGDSPGAGMHTPVQPEQSNPGWTPPHQAPQPPSDPSWPAQSAPAQPAPFPGQPAGGPWDSSSGMEGRHAPPSATPGIGTPADNVWGQEGHGWGSAEPGLYDPQPQGTPEPVRPAQADPMDHLAAQPHLVTPAMAAPAAPHFAEPAPAPAADPAPAPLNEPGAPEPRKPLFNMPDLGDHAEVQPHESIVTAEPPAPVPVESSPFPDAPDVPDWAGETAAVETQSEENSIQEAAQTQEAIDPDPATSAPVETENRSSEADVAEKAETKPATGQDLSFFKAFAEGAGIPEAVLQGRDPEDFARELGAVLQEVTSDLMGLLQARSQVKAMTRNANRTLISRSGNNALKFSPTPQAALQTMLSQTADEDGYLPLNKAMTAAFKDIQKHHVWTYAAMQKAAARFDETLSPKAIENEGQVAKSAFSNQNAKLWERMQERWTSLSSAYDDGLVGVFTQYFTEGYEELSGQDTDQET
ncbi:MAG: type VI secretion system-associated FHA domain protein TagH [Roseibium sp.]|uniref:type VI secretion system-associated FHA domain protein TagH n=1 Tax=Roseibium sp. TaxID=1936156 RepID=UPI001B03A198|nr:type VI secretion system-associated FHA domain protein TagH [Roseibium sp.]MBO6891421.1 type VI secretion system-associated FHA domain protein TagH [Roseibium sp.]MBO6929261.1 type VI secretion system-associated FHA domain protein TagH [Roseibium sp.]